MKNIWKSDSAEKIKLKLFRGTKEITFLYTSITLSLTKAEEKGLNGTDTRMLWMVKNIAWKDKVKNSELNDSLERWPLPFKTEDRGVVGLADFHFHISWKLHAWLVRTDLTNTLSS